MESETKTIRELVDRMAGTQGQTTFLISPETGRVLSFVGLRDHSCFLATQLRQAGLKQGDKVAFLMDNGLPAAQVFLGAMYGGFVSVPLNVRAGVSQLSYTLDHCDAKVVFVEDQYHSLIQQVMAEVRRPVELIPVGPDSFVDFETQLAEAPAYAPAPEDVALLMYSSGSTGQPKAAVHSHRTVLAGARNSISSHQLSSLDRSLLVLPLYHINAECVTLVPTLLSGGSVVVPRHFSVSHFWDWLDEYHCTWSALVPTIISQLIDWKDPRADNREAAFQRIRFLRSSSAPLSLSLHREFMDKFGLLLIQAMGSTEAGNIFSNPLPPGENKIGSPGLPWGFESKIVNGEGVEASPGESGEVFIRGPAVMQGYYKEPGATAAALNPDGWLRTGDLAYRDEHGYFFVVGRAKELIIKGGMNIAPRQIDEVLESHPSVLEAAVVGVPDRYVGEDLIAFVVLRTGMAGDEKELLAYCESRLGHFKTPTRIHFAEDLPKGPSGKVQRLRLLEASQMALGSSSGFGTKSATIGNGRVDPNWVSGATSSIEQAITEAWAEVLEQQPQIGIHCNFFELGGDSLRAIQCLSRLRERLPIPLSLSDFFANGTVAELANLVRQRLSTSGGANGQPPPPLQQLAPPACLPAIPLRDRALPCPLSPAQQRLWFMEQSNPGLPVYNEAEAVRLRGELNVNAMERALNVIVARHDTLRTTIQAIDNEPIMVVHDSWPLRLKRIDLSALAPAERQTEVERLLIDEPRQPYLLEAEPGIRATLLRIGPREHVFILMMHHIICDWSSEGVLWRELAASYRASSRNEPLALAPLPIQHGDYAAWQQQQIAETNFTEDLAFWEDNLRGVPALLEVPADRPRPATISYRGARQRFRIGSDLAAALRDSSRREKTSLFIVFAAALNAMIYRYTGRDDVPLGIPIADRDRPELQSVIGFLLHTQVLRTRLSSDMTFRELLARVQKGVLELFDHRTVPFDQVVRRVRPERNASYSPLFQVMINWRDKEQQLSFIGLEGLAVEPLLAESRTSKFDLTMFLTDGGDEIWLEMEYSTDLFDDARIERMFGHYETLLAAVASNPDWRLTELPLLTEAERRQILVDWNRTEVAYPRDRCLNEFIEEQVERTPDAVAVAFGPRQLTYREVNASANQLAHRLRKMGVGPAVLVAVCAVRSVELVVALLGTIKAGGAYVPIDPDYPRARLSVMLKDAAPGVVLTLERLLEVLPANTYPTICLDRDWYMLADEPTGNPPVITSAQNPAYVIYTSGSTGTPKGVPNVHRGIVNRLLWMQSAYPLNGTDRILQKTPSSFDVSVWEFFWPLMTGACLVVATPDGHKDPKYLVRTIVERKITTIHFVPSMLRAFLSAEDVTRCTSLRRVICSGEALPPDLVDLFFERLGAELHNLYGPTEAAVDVTYYSCRPETGRLTVPIGKPIWNTQIYVLDPHGNPLPIGIPGELHIGGVGLARGYLKRTELTAEKFVSNPFSSEPNARLYKSGDHARFLADGNIEYLGRLDHQVKIRGFRIELGEIETALQQHPGVAQAVVVARADSSGDKRLVGYIVASGHKAPERDELRTFLKGQLPDYMVPADFLVLQEFPISPNGKIDREALPAADRASADHGMAQRPDTARTLNELKLLSIWERTLGVQAIGVRDNFFDLGGHSLQAVRLVGEISESFGLNVSVPTFLLNPTVEGVARILEQSHSKRVPESIPLRSGQFAGGLFFLDAGVGLCRLAKILDKGPASFATVVPLPSAACQAAAANRIADLPRMEDLAAPHAALILGQGTSGPCVLAGHSFGGSLAFEVAHQLQRQGRQVDMIMLLDSWAMLPPWWRRLKALSPARAWESTTFRAGHLLWRTRRATGRVAEKLRSGSQSREESDEVNHPFSEVPWEILQKVYSNARKRHRRRRLDCRAVLFRSQDGAKAHLHAVAESMGWGGLFTGGLEIVDTPGDHLTLLKSPHIEELAQRFNKCLTRLYNPDQSHGTSPLKTDDASVEDPADLLVNQTR